MPEVARAEQHRRRGRGGPRRLVLPLPVPGAVGRALAGGALLPTGQQVTAGPTVEEFLAAA